MHKVISTWFFDVNWVFRYIVVVLAFYAPCIFSAYRNGSLMTATAGTPIPFASDYTFHIIWALAIPLFLTLVPGYYDAASEIGSASSGNTSTWMVVAGERISVIHESRGWLLTGLSVAALITAFIAFMNIRSFRSPASSPANSWWLPDGKFVLATWVFFGLCFIVAAVGLTLICRYCASIFVLRSLAGQHELLPDVASSSSTVSAFFTQFLITMLPPLLIPVLVVLTRVYRGGLAPNDFVTIFNAFVVPVCVLLILFIPVEFSRIPQKSRAARKQHLSEIDQQLQGAAVAIVEGHAGAGSTDDEIRAKIDQLEWKKKSIQANYPVWPIDFAKLAKEGSIVLGVLLSLATCMGLLLRFYMKIRLTGR